LHANDLAKNLVVKIICYLALSFEKNASKLFFKDPNVTQTLQSGATMVE
jgi:chromosome condensin MukBEF MukE localization factor